MINEIRNSDVMDTPQKELAVLIQYRDNLMKHYDAQYWYPEDALPVLDMILRLNKEIRSYRSCGIRGHAKE
jgi:hypothetical protein